jgi:hypothetical protein
MVFNNPSYYDPQAELQGVTDKLANLQSQVDAITGVGGSLSVTDLNVSGTANIESLTVTGTANIARLTVTGDATINGDLTVLGAVATGTLTVNGHIITAGNTPTVEVLTAAGSGAAATITGNDTAGMITITLGDGVQQMPAVGELVKLVFNQPYSAEPRVQITPVGSDSAKLQVFIEQTSTDFTIGTNQNPAIQKVYKFNYQVVQ